ncbi:MAG: xanthorhodopsin [Actinobacteria bacterium]|nr:xanthorhodopsin [Actinomycetota bacterium]NBY15223.1 xanthorhodopsin [Actinomycetota bacterium]
MNGLFDVSTLDAGHFNAVYNVLSFGFASMLATTIYLYISQARVLPKYRQAIVISGTVTLIALYHYWRIFDSFVAAHADKTIEFNEAYRYVDWLLTVPLLLMETIAVLNLPKGERKSLISRLVPASAFMIILGYPGEIATDNGPKMMWGALSTLPFLYILYILFVELTKSLESQPSEVADTVKRLRLLLIATWGVYPISFLLPVIMGDSAGGASAFVGRQVGYTVADVLAKCLFGLTIYKIARLKSAADDAAYASAEGMH